MQFDLSPELAELQATVRKIAQEKVAPRAREIDTTAAYPEDLFELFRETGLLGLVVPEAYGGSGAGIMGLTLAIEEVAKYSNTAALMLLLTRLPTGPVLIAGSEELKQQYVRGVATGEMRAGFGLSEPQAGSDVVGMRTKAVRDGDDWVLTGTKCWMSGVVQADWYCVFAKTGPADSRQHGDISCFVVERSWPGVSVGRTDDKMGVRGVDTGELVLDGVRVPARNVVGEVGGFRLAMLGLNSMRPIVAARGIGLAEGALMYAVDYVKERAAFGKTIADMQGIQWKIAELATEIEAARLLTYRSAVDGRRRQVHAGVRAVPVDGEVLRHRGRGEGVRRSAADARRRGLHEGPHDRAVLPRRAAAHDRRGHIADPARADRTRRARSRSVVGLSAR